jgi:hypothetical protein
MEKSKVTLKDYLVCKKKAKWKAFLIGLRIP